MKKDPCDIYIQCGNNLMKTILEELLGRDGFHITDKAEVKFVLDLPRPYALSALERMMKAKNKVIVATWNCCPEYLEDLYEFRPNALLTGEFFDMRNVSEALHYVFDSVVNGSVIEFSAPSRTNITPSEREVLRCVAQGWNNQKIAEQLHISGQTVKNRLCNIFKKLNVQSRTEAIVYYWQLCDQELS